MVSTRKTNFGSPPHSGGEASKTSQKTPKKKDVLPPTPVSKSDDSSSSDGEISDIEMLDLVNQASSSLLSRIADFSDDSKISFTIDKKAGHSDNDCQVIHPTIAGESDEESDDNDGDDEDDEDAMLHPTAAAKNHDQRYEWHKCILFIPVL